MGLQHSYDYNKQLVDSLREFNAPLEESFRFKLFTYRRFDQDGHFIHITTDQQWMDHCYTNGLFVSSAIGGKLIAALSEDQKILWSGYEKDEISNDPLYNALYNFDIWNGITFYEKGEDYVEVFAFSSTRSETQSSNFYINNFHLLDYVKGLFREKFHDSLTGKHVPSFELNSRPLAPAEEYTECSLEAHRRFFENNRVNRLYFPPPYGGFHITIREAMVLYHVSRKKTAKETALLLGISYRTVESHLNAVKIRFNGLSISHIMDMFIDGAIYKQVEYIVLVGSANVACPMG